MKYKIFLFLQKKKNFIDKVLAPVDFVAKQKTLLFDDIVYSGNLHIIIDPENKIQEILKENNRAFVFKKVAVEIGLSPKNQLR